VTGCCASSMPHSGPPTNAPRPEDFPIGSAESRAAARAMLEGPGGEMVRVIITRIGAPEESRIEKIIEFPLRKEFP